MARGTDKGTGFVFLTVGATVPILSPYEESKKDSRPLISPEDPCREHPAIRPAPGQQLEQLARTQGRAGGRSAVSDFVFGSYVLNGKPKTKSVTPPPGAACGRL